MPWNDKCLHINGFTSFSHYHSAYDLRASALVDSQSILQRTSDNLNQLTALTAPAPIVVAAPAVLTLP